MEAIGHVKHPEAAAAEQEGIPILLGEARLELHIGWGRPGAESAAVWDGTWRAARAAMDSTPLACGAIVGFCSVTLRIAIPRDASVFDLAAVQASAQAAAREAVRDNGAFLIPKASPPQT